MSNPFVGEIRMAGFNFAPVGWAECNGQLLPISQNTALFSLLGTQFGGDGRSNFALPNLQGRAPLDAGQGAGLTNYVIGEESGSETVTLLQSELAAQTHGVQGSKESGSQSSPSGAVWAVSPAPRRGSAVNLYTTTAPNASMNAGAVAPAGGSQPHNNMQPYLVLNFIIALQGIFPARN
jgi:microcystin-dependent protein